MKYLLQTFLLSFLIASSGCDSKSAISSTKSSPDQFLALPELILTYEYYNAGKLVGRDTKTTVMKNGNLHLLSQDGTSQEFKQADGRVFSRFTYSGSSEPYELFFDNQTSEGSEWKSESGVVSKIIGTGEYVLFNQTRRFLDLKVTYPPQSMSPDQDFAVVIIEQYAEGLGYVESRNLEGEIDEKLISIKSTNNGHSQSKDKKSE